MSETLVQCVVVLYKIAISDSVSMQTLLSISHKTPNLLRQVALLVYDNSPSPQQCDLSGWAGHSAVYHHPGSNGGLAAAYNEALHIAERSGIDWLLLLDQDTHVSSPYLDQLTTLLGSPLGGDVVAVVPRLTRNGVLLSPQTVVGSSRRPVKPSSSGVYQGTLTALNSAAALRTGAVRRTGGFPAEYWLDYLDHIMFHRLQAGGGKVYVLDTELPHQLSFQNLKSEMSAERYANMLRAEWRFIRETQSLSQQWKHRIILIRRALGHGLRRRSFTHAVLSLRYVFDRG